MTAAALKPELLFVTPFPPQESGLDVLLARLLGVTSLHLTRQPDA